MNIKSLTLMGILLCTCSLSVLAKSNLTLTQNKYLQAKSYVVHAGRYIKYDDNMKTKLCTWIVDTDLKKRQEKCVYTTDYVIKSDLKVSPSDILLTKQFTCVSPRPWSSKSSALDLCIKFSEEDYSKAVEKYAAL